MEEMAKQLQQAAADQAEFEERIKSPLLHMVPSVICHIPLATVFWPLDVIKNHLLAGKSISSAIKNQYSFKGIGFGLLGASVLGLDISKVYIEQFCENCSFKTKAAMGLAPLSLVPLGSIFEMLKINCQISQISMKQCWSNIVRSNGHLGLFRGIIPYSSLFFLTYSMLMLPIFYHQNPTKGIPGMTQNESESVQLNPLILLSYFIISTPMDMIKTHSMLGKKITFDTIRTFTPLSFAKCFAVKTCFMVLFGLVVSKGIEVTTLCAYSTKVSWYMERKKMETMSKHFALDNEFDELVPENTESLEIADILKKTLTKDG